ncbi:outer membrane beta-barrel protein [Tenacibaculum holothuriorum]|uniref:outer membrane beta-barrel protein n=1 Tax=Tenacibaculum holothuriorum TaxID=1635173 RepID=UPI00117C274A|nr:outer membrane beta-barrel protein [Tenacibaculum holothuriorum]
MKKLLLVIAMVAFGFTAKAQDGEFNLGANIGFPSGAISNATSFAFGIEANYLFEVSDNFKLGPSVSYQHFLGKSVAGVSLPSASIIPIAAAGRFGVSDEFTLGADLGYAVGASNVSGGAFYFRPMVGYDISEKIMLQAFYSGADTINMFGVGAMFSL